MGAESGFNRDFREFLECLEAARARRFAEAWPGRSLLEVDGLTLPFIGRDAFVRNKRAAGRLRDLADLEAIGERTDPPAS